MNCVTVCIHLLLFVCCVSGQEVDDCWDLYACCSFWARNGHCGLAEMTLVCSRSCGLCSLSRVSSDQNCIDHFSSCPYWSTTGYCTKNFYWMEENCQRSCGKCGVPKSTGCSAQPYSDECYDKDACCDHYAASFGCQSDFMQRNCQVACRVCQARWPKPDACLNHFALCKHRARQGECTATRARWMGENCRNACGLCSSPRSVGCTRPPQNLTPRPVPRPQPTPFRPVPTPRPQPRPQPRPPPRPQPRPTPGDCTAQEICENGAGCDESCEGELVCSNANRSFILVRPESRNRPTVLRKKREIRKRQSECTCRCRTGYYRELNNAFSPCVPFDQCTPIDLDTLRPLPSLSVKK